MRRAAAAPSCPVPERWLAARVSSGSARGWLDVLVAKPPPTRILCTVTSGRVRAAASLGTYALPSSPTAWRRGSHDRAARPTGWRVWAPARHVAIAAGIIDGTSARRLGEYQRPPAGRRLERAVCHYEDLPYVVLGHGKQHLGGFVPREGRGEVLGGDEHPVAVGLQAEHEAGEPAGLGKEGEGAGPAAAEPGGGVERALRPLVGEPRLAGRSVGGNGRSGGYRPGVLPGRRRWGNAVPGRWTSRLPMLPVGGDGR